MAIETVCAGCGKRLSVADESAGKRARCPACGHINPIPLNPSQLNSPPPLGTGLPFDDFASRGARDSSASGYDIDAPDGDLHNAFDGVDRDQSGDRASTPPEAERYWMRAVDGTEYGPVDRQTLQRWFREGRVGPGYQLRQSRYENWRPADEFQASVGGSSSNPFAGPTRDPNPYRPVASTNLGQTYPHGDQGVFVLVMGMLGIFCCPIFGLVAWVVGHQALKSINAGLANPNSKGLVQIGYYLGIASVVMFILCSSGRVLLMIFD